MSRALPPERHRWLDPWRGARGLALRNLVSETASTIRHHEGTLRLRERARRPADQVNHLAAVEVVVANLAHAVLHPPETGRLAVLTGNGMAGRTRYQNPALGKPLRSLLSAMEGLGLLTLRPSPRRREASSLAPTAAFTALVSAAGITLADFGRQEGEELVLLARTSVEWRHGLRFQYRDMAEYQETAETIAMRRDVRALNAFLARADIAFVDDGAAPVDVNDRRLRRHFVIAESDPLPQRFDRGGRLYGGFWQNLKRSRRAGIRIDGERIATLDYSSMFPRLALAAAGAPPPQGDLYAIPGLTEHRRAVKLATNTLLFDTSSRRPAWPKPDEDADEMPEGWTVSRFRQALLARHPGLSSSLGVGLGHHLMHTESRIMVGVLMSLMAEGVVALPLHDGLLVKMSSAREAGTMMAAIEAAP